MIKTDTNEKIHLGLPLLGLTDYFQFHIKNSQKFWVSDKLFLKYL